MSIKQTIKANLKNVYRGKRVQQKMVIFESDDWGSNYIAGKEEFNQLVKAGILSENSSPYAKYDAIARAKDLEMLFETLSLVKDAHGNPAVFSTFFAPVNPDFEKIAATDFQEYHYETFLETLAKTGEDKAVASLWKVGIEDGMISPAYHAREHLCVPLWMEHLQNNHKKVREAFNHRFYSVKVEKLPKEVSSFRPSLFFQTENQKKYIQESLKDGLNILENILNVRPTVFCPPNGLSHIEYDQTLASVGIKSIKANPNRLEPDGRGGITTNKISLNRHNKWGQHFYTRNCWFEPYQLKQNPVDFCMTQIEGAFNWNKAAVICSHRISYMGGIEAANRERGIREFESLLQTIVKKWPDVVFASSEDYSKILHSEA